MENQNFNNHRMVYPLHHFVFYPLSLGLLIFALFKGFSDMEHHFEWVAMSIGIILLMLLSLMMRQHYALKLQDRIIRMELRLRYFILTQEKLEKYESSLTLKQLAALRFASDEELPPLLKKTIDQNLSPKEIKKSIRQWIADTNRV